MADLLAGECALCKETGEVSDALWQIKRCNGVLIHNGTPEHMQEIFRAERMEHEVQWKRRGLEKWLFKNDYTDEEAIARIGNLIELSRARDEAWAESLKRIESDPAYQEFDRKYSAANSSKKRF